MQLSVPASPLRVAIRNWLAIYLAVCPRYVPSASCPNFECIGIHRVVLTLLTLMVWLFRLPVERSRMMDACARESASSRSLQSFA